MEQTLQSKDQQTVGGDSVEKLLDEASYTMLEHIVYKVEPVQFYQLNRDV